MPERRGGVEGGGAGGGGVALGFSTIVAGSAALALGAFAEVCASGAIAIGHRAQCIPTTPNLGIALGMEAIVCASGGIAIGGHALVEGGSIGGVAIGINSKLDSVGVAIGRSAAASASGGVAIGEGALVQAGANQSIALGHNTLVSVSAALGFGMRSLLLGKYGVTTLPTITVNNEGGLIYVSNGAAGSPVLAFSDGVNWLRSDTLAAVSTA